MNMDLLMAAAGAGLLALLVGLLLLTKRRARGRAAVVVDGSAAPGTPAPAADKPAPASGHAPLWVDATRRAEAPTTSGADAQHLATAQRLATTEALRQARQRKADDAVRLAAQRQAADRERAQAPPPRVRSVPPPSRPMALLPQSPPPPPPPLPRRQGPPTVLLADDSKVVRAKTGRLLEKQGWRVLLAEDGFAALQALETGTADLLVTDVEMPGLDGFELTRRLRAHPQWAALPVIMITSSDERHRAQAMAAGVNVLLGKPYAEAAFLAQVQQLLSAPVPDLALN